MNHEGSDGYDSNAWRLRLGGRRLKHGALLCDCTGRHYCRDSLCITARRLTSVEFEFELEVESSMGFCSNGFWGYSESFETAFAISSSG